MVRENGACIVQFVSGRNQADICICGLQMLQVIFFALPPWRLGIEIGVSATFYYMSDALAEAAANFFKHRRATTILNNVMQESGDGQIFIASRFEHQTGNAQQMRNVRNSRSLRVWPSCLRLAKSKPSSKRGPSATVLCSGFINRLRCIVH